MSQRLVMVVDASRCIDCKACLVACRTANDVPMGHHRNWVRQSDPDGDLPKAAFGFQPGACMHCEEPLCVHACVTGATWKDPATGVVLVKRELCIGCGACVAACPYQARYVYDGKTDKCDYCTDRRAQDLLPACMDCCPTDVRVFGDVYDPPSDVALLLKNAKNTVVVENAETPTTPNMLYINGTFDQCWPKPAQFSASVNLMRPFSTLFQIGGGLLLLALTATGVREYLFPDRKTDTDATPKQDPPTSEPKPDAQPSPKPDAQSGTSANPEAASREDDHA